MNSGWNVRTKTPSRPRATWAAVALAVVSLLVQCLNFWRTDLKPVLEVGQQNQAALTRIERKQADHDERLVRLEAIAVSNRARIEQLEGRRVSVGVIRRVKR